MNKRIFFSIAIACLMALNADAQGPAPETTPGEVRATSPDPDTAVRQEKVFNGVPWGLSYYAAMKKAKAEGRPVLVAFTAGDCPNCRVMEQKTLARREVVPHLAKFITVQLYTDSVPIASITPAQRRSLAKANMERQLALTDFASLPVFAVLSPDGVVIKMTPGFREHTEFIGFLTQAFADSHAQ